MTIRVRSARRPSLAGVVAMAVSSLATLLIVAPAAQGYVRQNSYDVHLSGPSSADRLTRV